MFSVAAGCCQFKISKMKQLKWDAISIDEKTKQTALTEMHSLERNKARAAWTLREFQEVYESWSGDRPIEDLSSEILDFGGCMVKFDVKPSLISMGVPFHIRRQVYEYYEVLGELIHLSLNAKDLHYNAWAEKQASRKRAPIDKSIIARRLWEWYYSVFEPVAKRFVASGTEHVANFR